MNKIYSLLFAFLFIFGCASNNNLKPAYWPTEQWIAKESRSTNYSLLKQMYEQIKSLNAPYRSITIIQDGYIISEETFLENGLEVNCDDMTAMYSLTKSINSAALGYAIKEGLLPNEDDFLSNYFPEYFTDAYDDYRKELKIVHLLTMTTGASWNEVGTSYNDSENPYTEWQQSEDRVAYFFNLDFSSPPGREFNYCTPASQIIPAVIQKVQPLSHSEYVFNNILSPLGIKENEIIWRETASGLTRVAAFNISPHNMAKFGLLYLYGGKWDGHEILSEDWILKSFEPFVARGYKEYFGYHWYIAEWNETTYYYAFGYNGQMLFIVPSRELVVAITANGPTGVVEPEQLFRKYILEAVK